MWGGGQGQRSSRQRSDPFARSLTPFSGMDSLMNPLGGEMDALERALQDMNQTFCGLVRIETLPDKTMRVNFVDMDIYERTKIDYNAETNVLTVSGEHRSGNHVAHASRSVLLPCSVTNTNKIRAESRGDGSICVMIPPDAQASAGATKPIPIKVNVTSSGGAGASGAANAGAINDTTAAAGNIEPPAQPAA